MDIESIKQYCDESRNQTILVDGIEIAPGCSQHLGEVLNTYYSYAKKVVLVADTNTYPILGKELAEKFNLEVVVLEADGLHADEHGVGLLEQELNGLTPDFFVVVGSGSLHDIVRYHAYHRKINFISIPTAASVDGFVSTMAAMTWKGMKQTFTAVSPVYVLADSLVFSQAPKRLTASGVGDLLGKYTALCDWEIAHALLDEYISWPVVNWEKGFLQDLVDNLEGLNTGSLEAYENLMAGLLLSGLAMQMIGYSRPASGCEHHCSHLWEEAAINEPIDYYHGEKVGVGMILCATAYKKALAQLKTKQYTVKEHMEVEFDLLKESFKDPHLYEEIEKENTPNVMADVTREKIEARIEKILPILEALPCPEQMVEWLNLVGAPTQLEDIGLDESYRAKTLRVSPYVRKRLTFMRLLKFFSFYEDVIS